MAGIYLLALISAAIATSSALPVRSVQEEQDDATIAERDALREVVLGVLTFSKLAVSENCTYACMFVWSTIFGQAMTM